MAEVRVAQVGAGVKVQHSQVGGARQQGGEHAGTDDAAQLHRTQTG